MASSLKEEGRKEGVYMDSSTHHLVTLTPFYQGTLHSPAYTIHTQQLKTFGVHLVYLLSIVNSSTG